MGDETVKIFLNTNGTMDDVSDELKAFLDYVPHLDYNILSIFFASGHVMELHIKVRA